MVIAAEMTGDRGNIGHDGVASLMMELAHHPNDENNPEVIINYDQVGDKEDNKGSGDEGDVDGDFSK